MRIAAFVLLLLFCGCASTEQTGISTEILATCTHNTGDQAIFESNNPNYSEVIIKSRTHRYKVGKKYVLILRK
jgi:hypothetical protein